MQPFKLPEFYVPWPARLNPNLEGSRTHSKAWAYEMGILTSEKDAKDSAVWDEHDFDSHDYALLCAYTHPDAPLRNDLFSYQREVEEEGELANCVLVLERFLNIDTQRSADLVNEVLSSRLYHPLPR